MSFFLEVLVRVYYSWGERTKDKTRHELYFHTTQKKKERKQDNTTYVRYKPPRQ